MYKHFLTDKVLRDPRQRRFFKAKDLTDLFTLGDEYAGGPRRGGVCQGGRWGLLSGWEPPDRICQERGRVRKFRAGLAVRASMAKHGPVD